MEWGRVVVVVALVFLFARPSHPASLQGSPAGVHSNDGSHQGGGDIVQHNHVAGNQINYYFIWSHEPPANVLSAINSLARGRTHVQLATVTGDQINYYFTDGGSQPPLPPQPKEVEEPWIEPSMTWKDYMNGVNMSWTTEAPPGYLYGLPNRGQQTVAPRPQTTTTTTTTQPTIATTTHKMRHSKDHRRTEECVKNIRYCCSQNAPGPRRVSCFEQRGCHDPVAWGEEPCETVSTHSRAPTWSRLRVTKSFRVKE